MACALIELKLIDVAVRLLNTQTESVTVCSGETLANLEIAGALVGDVDAVSEGAVAVDAEKMLPGLVKQSGSVLSAGEKTCFLTFSCLTQL